MTISFDKGGLSGPWECSYHTVKGTIMIDVPAHSHTERICED